MAVVTQTSIAQLQTQYGTLKRAIEKYLDGEMPVPQQAALELVVPSDHIAAVAQTRLFKALTGVMSR